MEAAAKESSEVSVTENGWLRKSIQRKTSLGSLPVKVLGAAFDPYLMELGSKSPEEVPVFIEVASGSRNKYEWDQEIGVMMLDRVLHSAGKL